MGSFVRAEIGINAEMLVHSGEVLLGLLWRAKEPAVTAITSSGRQVPEQVRRGSGGAASPRKFWINLHINIK